MVSVIIPVYNAETTIEKCVESLAYGAYKNLEIILVDDQSTDGSWDVCKGLEKRYKEVSAFQNEVNSGVSHTRNVGLEKAQGSLIAFVDSDDWVSGQYLDKLVGCYEKNPQAFVICGHHYIDRTVGIEHDYLWTGDDNEIVSIHREGFFDLAGAFLLQQVWNKLFIWDIIDKNNLRFDTNQSMGEDYQFVLEYMKAAGVSVCTVVNSPLYYYIRANNSSLMSHFGLIDISKDQQRLHFLAELSGENGQFEERVKKEEETIKRNAVYHIMRNPNLKQHERIERVEALIGSEYSDSIIRSEKISILKERIMEALHRLKMTPQKIKSKVRNTHNRLVIASSRRKLHNDQFTIISQNCIGGVLYHDMKLPFMSPTINLFINSLDFIKFAKNIEHYVNSPLTMEWGEQYPIGHLDDILLYFQHYNTCSEAKDAWERRKQRMIYDRIIVVGTDRDGFKEEYINQWNEISYPKVLFSCKARRAEGVLYCKKWKQNDEIGDIITNRAFYQNNVLVSMINRL